MKADSFFSSESPSSLHLTRRSRKSLAPLLAAHNPADEDEGLLTKRLDELAFDLNFGKDMPDFRSRLGQAAARPSSISFEDGGSKLRRWCCRCRLHVEGAVSYEATPKTFLASAVIFLTGGVFGCFLAPCFSNACKEARVHCNLCGAAV